MPRRGIFGRRGETSGISACWEVLDDREAALVYHHWCAATRSLTTPLADSKGCGRGANQWHGRHDASLGRVRQDPARLGCREQPLQLGASMDHGHGLVTWLDI